METRNLIVPYFSMKFYNFKDESAHLHIHILAVWTHFNSK